MMENVHHTSVDCAVRDTPGRLRKHCSFQGTAEQDRQIQRRDSTHQEGLKITSEHGGQKSRLVSENRTNRLDP